MAGIAPPEDPLAAHALERESGERIEQSEREGTLRLRWAREH
jgi:hypothetical protein